MIKSGNPTKGLGGPDVRPGLTSGPYDSNPDKCPGQVYVHVVVDCENDCVWFSDLGSQDPQGPLALGRVLTHCIRYAYVNVAGVSEDYWRFVYLALPIVWKVLPPSNDCSSSQSKLVGVKLLLVRRVIIFLPPYISSPEYTHLPSL